VRIPAARASQRHYEHPAADFAALEPVGGWLGRTADRWCLHVVDIVDSQVRMLEQVRGLRIDLEWIFLIQQVRIKPFSTHPMLVLHTTPLSWRARATRVWQRRTDQGTGRRCWLRRLPLVVKTPPHASRTEQERQMSR